MPLVYWYSRTQPACLSWPWCAAMICQCQKVITAFAGAWIMWMCCLNYWLNRKQRPDHPVIYPYWHRNCGGEKCCVKDLLWTLYTQGTEFLPFALYSRTDSGDVCSLGYSAPAVGSWHRKHRISAKKDQTFGWSHTCLSAYQRQGPTCYYSQCIVMPTVWTTSRKVQ